MFCTNCGAMIPDESRFCTSCGAPAPQMPTQPQAPVMTEAPAMPQMPVEPQTPVMPEVPIMTEPPVMPDNPTIPQTPVMHEPPVMPQMPVEPQAPVMQQMPQQPQQFAQAQGMPQQPQQFAQAQGMPQQPQQFAQAPVMPQMPQQPQPKKKSKAPLIIIISVVVVLILGAGGFFGYKFYKKSQDVKAFKKEITTMITAADVSAAEGNYSAAIGDYLQVLDKDPKNTDAVAKLTQAYIGYARSYAKTNEYRQAIRILQEADPRAEKEKLDAEIVSLQAEQADYEAEQARLEEERRLEEARLEEERLEQERLQAINDAPNTLYNYLYDVIVPEYGDVQDSYMYVDYIGSVDTSVMAGFLDVKGVLAHHITDMDCDGVDEMVVFLAVAPDDNVYWNGYDLDTQDIYAVVYEVDGYDVYPADSIRLARQWFGGCDYEFDRLFSIVTNNVQYYGMDVTYNNSLLYEGESMGIALFYYNGSEIVRPIDAFVSGTEEELFEDNTFEEVADFFKSIGLYQAAYGIGDGSHSQLNFTADAYTDAGVELLFVASGYNYLLLDQEAFFLKIYPELMESGDLSLLENVEYTITKYTY